MIGDKYWAVSVQISPAPGQENNPMWSASIEFFDDGFCDDESTQGRIYNRYLMSDAEKAIKILMADAKRIGIEIRDAKLTIPGDGDCEFLPSNWRELLKTIADNCGLKFPY